MKWLSNLKIFFRRRTRLSLVFHMNPLLVNRLKRVYADSFCEEGKRSEYFQTPYHEPSEPKKRLFRHTNENRHPGTTVTQNASRLGRLPVQEAHNQE